MLDKHPAMPPVGTERLRDQRVPRAFLNLAILVAKEGRDAGGRA